MADITPLRKKPQKFPEGFVVGAIVQLKSRGVIMTVTELLPGEPPVVHCEWLVEGFPHEKSFPVAALRLAAVEAEEGVEE